MNRLFILLSFAGYRIGCGLPKGDWDIFRHVGYHAPMGDWVFRSANINVPHGIYNIIKTKEELEDKLAKEIKDGHSKG